MFANSSFDVAKNKFDCYRVKDCIKIFCKDLRDHAMKLIGYKKKKEMILLTYKENNSYEKQKVCYLCQKVFSTDNIKGVAFSGAALNKKYHKVRDHFHYTGKFRGAAHSICNLRYKKH